MMASSDMNMNVKANLETSEELRAFIRAEVHKALLEERESLYKEFLRRLQQDVRTRSGLPSWARMETKGTPVEDW